MFFFVISSERSGSNLITKVMDAHPDCCGPSPLHMIRVFSRNLFRYGDLQLDDNWSALIQDVADLTHAQLGKWQTGIDAGDLLNDVQQRDLKSIIEYIYLREATAQGKQHVVIKENRMHSMLPYILATFPDTRFVYLVRDPRDMALSWKMSPNHPGGVQKAVDIWSEDQTHGLEVHGYLKSLNRILMMRYEDLVRTPETQTKRLCEFLGLPAAPEMLNFHQNRLTRENAERLKDWRNLGQPLMSHNTEKYKAGLTEVEVRYIESTCASLMEALGYPLDYSQSDEDFAEPLAEIEAKSVPEPEVLSVSEQAIREKRLAVIYRIIARKNYHFFE